MAFGREIARAFVSLFVRREGLSSDLRAAETEVRQSTQKMQADAEAVGGGFSQWGDNIKQSTGPLRSFSQAIGGVISLWTRALGVIGLVGGAVTAVVAAVQALGEASRAASKELRDARENAKELSERVAKLTAPAARPFSEELSEVDKQLDNIRPKVDDLVRRRGSLTGRERLRLAGYFDTAQQLLRDQARLEDLRRNAEEAAAKKRKEQAAEVGRAMAEEFLSAQEDAQAEFLKNDPMRPFQEDFPNVLRRIHEERLRQIQVEAEARVQAELDASRRIAQQAESLFGNQRALASLDQLAQYLKRIDANTFRR